MMETIGAFLLVAVVLFALVFAIWQLYCNDKTFKQRHDLLYLPNGIDILNVSYEKHMWTLIKFGDWRPLYPKRLIDEYEKVYDK